MILFDNFSKIVSKFPRHFNEFLMNFLNCFLENVCNLIEIMTPLLNVCATMPVVEKLQKELKGHIWCNVFFANFFIICLLI